MTNFDMIKKALRDAIGEGDCLGLTPKEQRVAIADLWGHIYKEAMFDEYVEHDCNVLKRAIINFLESEAIID